MNHWIHVARKDKHWQIIASFATDWVHDEVDESIEPTARRWIHGTSADISPRRHWRSTHYRRSLEKLHYEFVRRFSLDELYGIPCHLYPKMNPLCINLRNALSNYYVVSLWTAMTPLHQYNYVYDIHSIFFLCLFLLHQWNDLCNVQGNEVQSVITLCCSKYLA